MPVLPFVSAPSANAILSDLRPTTLTAPALDYVNRFLDELLVSLVTAAQSINPSHLRTRGVPAVFAAERDRDREGSDPQPQTHSSVGALGHAAVGEAEVEIRGWYDSHPTARKDVSGFPPAGKGHGLDDANATQGRLRLPGDSDLPTAFPVRQAVDLMRVKVILFSTFAPSVPSDDELDEVLDLWKSVGGDVAEETVSPAGLWLTAILEHVSEHVLSKLSQVVARDSSVTAAGVQDLYTALCEDDSVYGFFKHMEVRKALEAEIKHETKGRRPQRTASVTAIPTSSPPSDKPSSASISSPHGSKSSLGSTTQADNRKSYVSPAARPMSEQFFKSIPKGVSSSQLGTNHKRTPSVLSISKQQISESPEHYTSRRPSISDKAEEDFDAFLRSGETMRVSLTPSRFSTFENTPSSSPSRQPEIRATGSTLSVPPSSSETSLLSSSTQASTPESGRIGMNYRQVAGRSWNSSTKLMPRDAAIEEREEEDHPERPSVMELLKKERDWINETSNVPRTVPAVILGTPTSPVDADFDAEPDSPGTNHSDLSHRTSSLHPTSASVPVSEPSDSPRMSPEVLSRSMRSASEGAPDLPANGSFRRNTARAERMEAQRDTRDMASFFSSTAPPRAPVHSPPPHVEDNLQTLHLRHRMSSLKNIMSLMKKGASRDSERQSLTPSPSPQTLRSSTSSSDHHRPSLLRSQKSSSSFASGSTVMALASSVSSDPHGGNATHAESSSPVRPRELLRKPSLVRKWAVQVTGDHQRSNRRWGPTPRNTPSPLPLHEKDHHHELADASPSHEPSSPDGGLGLGGVDFAECTFFCPIEESPVSSKFSRPASTVDQGPQAALAQLTAGSTKSSPTVSRTDIDSPRPSTNLPEVRVSQRDSPRLVASPLHQRVLELAREGDDGSPSSIPVPPVAAIPHSPETGSTLGGSSRAASVTSENFVSAEEMDDEIVGTPEIDPTETFEETSTVTPDFDAASVTPTPPLGVISSTTSSSKAVSPTPPGFVAMEDLVPLRHILDHATDAKECQLLLDAILSQLGVPRSPLGGTVARPEDRVVAWLLAGREGPVGDVVSNALVAGIGAGALRRPVSHLSASSTKPRSQRRSLSSEVTIKSRPVLPDRGAVVAVDLNSGTEQSHAANGNGNGVAAPSEQGTAPKVDMGTEAAAVAAVVVEDNLVAKRSPEPRVVAADDA